MMATWADDEDIVCVHPGGARLVGYDAVRASWEQLFAGDAELSFRLEQVVMIETVGLAMQSADRARLFTPTAPRAAQRARHQRLHAHAVRAGGWCAITPRRAADGGDGEEGPLH